MIKKYALLIVLLGCSVLSVANIVFADAPSAPVVVAACTAENLQLYQECVADCDAGFSDCSAEGTEANYLTLLRNGINNCTYPVVDNSKKVNALKKIVTGFKEFGVITRAEAKLLIEKIKSCRRALRRS